jgi:signal transduction histidine kinase
MSLVLHLLVMDMVDDKSASQFNYQATNAQLAIQTRVRSYIDVLRGAGALFYTSDNVTREQFQAYVRKLNLPQSFPGINNLNFAPRVTAQEKNGFIASVRADTSVDPEGYPGFSIKPAGERPEYHVLTYLEPMEGNLGSFGLDLASNPQVANALAVSRDNGQLTSSGRIIRIDGPEKHVGMAMRLPLYRRGMPLNTVAERRAAYLGSLGAGINLNILMAGAIDSSTLHHLRVRLYDAGESEGQNGPSVPDADHLLFDSDVTSADKPGLPESARLQDLYVKRVSMTVGPRVWEAEFSASKSEMTTGIDTYLGWMVLIGGITASTLLFSIYYSMMTARRRAVELAREMTKDLRTSEASLAEAQHMARLGSWTLEPLSGRMRWSAQTYRIFGMNHFADGPQYEDFLRRLHADDKRRVVEGLEQSMETGEEYNTEHRITRLDGSVRWVQTIARLGRDEQQMLLRGTIMDITDRKQTVEALKRSQELLRELTAHQDRVKEDERKRIAREIHDELGQTLLALRIDVSMLDARTGKSHPKLNEKVRSALNHIDATVKTIRTIINNLRPAVLDLGLTAAIEWQVAEFRRRTGITCDLVMSDKEFEVDDTRATSLFRILQESLTNVIRHANASHVMIELFQEDERLVMKITDNGVGIYPENRKTGNSFGLVGVEERIHALNGEFLITSAPGKGTTLTIYIPLEHTGRGQYPFKLVDSTEREKAGN